MEKFTESEKCISRKYCFPCLVSKGWRKKMREIYEWDGECPFGVVIEDFPKRLTEPKEVKPPLQGKRKEFEERRKKLKNSLPEIQKNSTKSPCSRKHCRLGDMECDQYWGCRDTCRISNERITKLTACPRSL